MNILETPQNWCPLLRRAKSWPQLQNEFRGNMNFESRCTDGADDGSAAGLDTPRPYLVKPRSFGSESKRVPRRTE